MLTNPLWQFSTAFYCAPEVEAGCLAWQEQRGADVNILLLCLWCAVAGCRLTERDLQRLIAEAGVRGWQRNIIVPLRAVRHASKIENGDAAGLLSLAGDDAKRLGEELYQALLAVELQAEALEQHMLWCWVKANLPLTGDGASGQLVERAQQNLLAYGAALSIDNLEAGLITCFSDALLSYCQ